MSVNDVPDSRWRKSSRTGPNENACVEVLLADGTDVVLVRDSVDPTGPRLVFSTGSWTTFVREIQQGRFHRTG